MDKSRSRRGMARGIGTGAGKGCEWPSSTARDGSPNDDESEGGGTDGYVNSWGLPPPFTNPACGSLSLPGVVMLVAALVEWIAGEKRVEECEAGVEEGGVVEVGR